MPQKNKGVSQKNQNKNFVKKRITKYFGGLDPMNELFIKIWNFIPAPVGSGQFLFPLMLSLSIVAPEFATFNQHLPVGT